jgi:hypothetical protein
MLKRIHFIGGPADGHSELYESLPRVGCPFEVSHRESVVSHIYRFDGERFVYVGACIICGRR